MATTIVDNSGTEEMTEKQILDIHKKLGRSIGHWPMRIVGWGSIAIFIWFMYKLLRVVF